MNAADIYHKGNDFNTQEKSRLLKQHTTFRQYNKSNYT